MGRAILGVIVGYIAMAAVVFGGLTGAYLALGADRTFQPGTYHVSATWLAVWFVVSVLAAIVGGLVGATIARRPKPVFVLAVLVLLLGAASAAADRMKPDPGPRAGDVSNLEAMGKARQPAWVLWLTPLIGAAGVLAGGRLMRPRAVPPPAPGAPPAPPA